ncbi:MAG: YIP1 family protein [bacterium]
MTSGLDNENESVTPASGGLTLPPWEELNRYGFLNALYLTTKNALLYPDRFFGRMPTSMGLGRPLVYALILGVIGAFLEWMWSLTGSSLEMFMENDLSEFLEGPVTMGFIFVMSPALFFIGIFLGTALTHLCLMLLGGNRLGFEATFRAVAYSHAAAIFLVIPVCGNIISFFWGLAILVIGLQRIHDIETWRAALAICLPLILCVFSCAGVGLLFFGFSSLLG